MMAETEDVLVRRCLPVALAAVRPLCRRWPHERNDLQSVARIGLLAAIRRYNPAMGSLSNYVHQRALGAALDYLRRQTPAGFREDARRGESWPEVRVFSEFRPRDRDGRWSGGDGITSSAEEVGRILGTHDPMPIGWELENQEEILAIAGRLPTRAAEAVRLSYLHAGMARPGDCARAMGVSVSCISNQLSRAYGLLRERLVDRVG